MNDLTATTRVQLTVEIQTGTYGGDWRVEDVIKQATREAPDKLRALFKDQYRSITIVGEPKVRLVVINEEMKAP